MDKRTRNAVIRILSSILILSIIMGCIPSIGAGAASKTKTIRIVVDGVFSDCKAEKKGNDWYVKVKDVKKILNIAKPAGKKSGKVLLDAVARKADINYECDMVLNAAYFWTDMPYGESDYVRAFDLGLVPEKYKANREKTITSTEFRKLLIDLITMVNKKKVSYFKKNVTDHKKKLLAGEAVGMAYYAAWAIGAEEIGNVDFDSELINLSKEGNDAFWDDRPFAFAKLFPNFYGDRVKLPGYIDQYWDNDRTAAYIWLFWHGSDYSGKQMIPFDYKENHFHLKEEFTWEQAIAMITRLYDSSSIVNASKVVKVTNAKAVQPDSMILSDKLLKKANSQDKTSSTDMPRLTGVVITNTGDLSVFPAAWDDARIISEWGFNSLRLMLRYEYFFDKDVSKVDLTKLKQLDQMVADAIRYDLHLNIGFESLPGRYYEYVDQVTRTGSFDMFVNDKHLKQAQKVWEILAERYKDIPSRYLSFTPLWETMNPDLSTGAGAPEYTWKDAQKATGAIMESIRKQDPDRFIIFEPTPTNRISNMVTDDYADEFYKNISAKFDNVMMMSNFCEWTYVYQEMPFYGDGKDIDFYAQGMYKQGYPNYIYATALQLGDDYPAMEIGGFLPAGTEVEVYLRYSGDDTQINITADRNELYRESLREKNYELTKDYLSQHYPYAESEKKISLDLNKDTDKISLSATGYLELCGIKIVLPEKYAVEKLYYPSQYDYYYGNSAESYPYMRPTSTVLLSPNVYDGKSGYHITINKDISFTSDTIAERSDSESIAEFFKEYADYFPETAIRFETAYFNLGTTLESMKKYYADFFKQCEKYGHSWYSNDYMVLFVNRYPHDDGDGYAYEAIDSRGLDALGMEFTEYKGKYLEVSLLKFLQKYQCNERW